MDFENTIIRAIAQGCNLDLHRVDRESDVAELGLDSLNMMTIIADLEETYRVQFDAEAVLALFQARNVAEFIERARTVVSSSEHAAS